MQSIEELIPKDKGDTESTERLFGHSYEQVKPIISRLLEWIQDGNCPVAYPVGKYLSTIAPRLTTQILTVRPGSSQQALCAGGWRDPGI